jgi:hypothetical protein
VRVNRAGNSPVFGRGKVTLGPEVRRTKPQRSGQSELLMMYLFSIKGPYRV